MLNIFKSNKSNTKKLPMSEKFYFSTLSFPTFTFEKKILIDEYLRVLREVSFALQKNKIQKNFFQTATLSLNFFTKKEVNLICLDLIERINFLSGLKKNKRKLIYLITTI